LVDRREEAVKEERKIRAQLDEGTRELGVLKRQLREIDEQKEIGEEKQKI